MPVKLSLSSRRPADTRPEMVGTESLGEEARQAQRPLQGQSRRRAQARGHSAPHVDQRNRVQLVEEGGCRLASITGSQSSYHTVGKDVPAGTMAMVSSTDFVRASEWTTAIATLNRQRHLTPSCGGLTPTAERTVGPARTIAESLTPRPGIREHYLERHSAFPPCRHVSAPRAWPHSLAAQPNRPTVHLTP
jgi:hypothetical protein